MGLSTIVHATQISAPPVYTVIVMIFLFVSQLSLSAFAGGGPANVLVMVNGEDAEAAEVAEHYEFERSLPPNHRCEVFGIDPSADEIPFVDYELHVLSALNDCLSILPQPDEIDILLLVRGLPYRVAIPGGFTASLEAMLQVSNATRHTGELVAGSDQDQSSGTYYATVRNPLWIGAGSESDFELSNPSMAHYTTASRIVNQEEQTRSFSRGTAGRYWGIQWENNLFLVSRLDGFDYADAFDLIDRGVSADGHPPAAPITCMAAADSARGARDPECHFTISMLDAAGIDAVWIDAHDPTLSGVELAGLMTGTTSLQDGIDGNTWVDGAFAANLTSYGATPNNFRCSDEAECPGTESQTSIARFVRGGATFAHGTANEPLNNSFPGAGMYLLSTMGYGAIESAFFTSKYLYWQSIYLGDPLSSPWAERPEVSIDGTVWADTPVSIDASHTEGIRELRLYADGVRVDIDLALADTIGASEGDTVQLLAVAIAENPVLSRTGWPEPGQHPRPDIQGWAMADITVGPDQPIDPGSDTGDAEPTPRKAKATGCSTAPATLPFWAISVLVVIGRLRIRRDPSESSSGGRSISF
jgi:uncharacterized protein (TIGR03790 family)